MNDVAMMALNAAWQLGPGTRLRREPTELDLLRASRRAASAEPAPKRKRARALRFELPFVEVRLALR